MNTSANENTTSAITERTTYSELLSILRSRSETIEAAEVEKAEREREAKETRMREIFGEDYDDVIKPDEESAVDMLVKAKRRPGAIQLRENVPCIARIDLGGGSIEVFANGYSVYDNGDRKTVLWVPDCGSTTYFFGQLRENEKLYQDQKSEIGEDILGPAPWYNALVIAGENSIERNLEHPKSFGTRSDEDEDEWEEKANYRWVSCTHFDSPEEALLKKEQAEQIKVQVDVALSKKQHDAVRAYYFDDLTQEEAADVLGISQSSFNERLSNAKTALEKNLKNLV
ncbi:MAG: sigma-70 family RNA polymerase sigma factor [Oscillospiraceae bacterium]|nr:sigma-70 family RNA polymerase sigma factor [Oscillospiraceae bacterium]